MATHTIIKSCWGSVVLCACVTINTPISESWELVVNSKEVVVYTLVMEFCCIYKLLCWIYHLVLEFAVFSKFHHCFVDVVWLCYTSFLQSVDVMDYSLLVGIDEEKRQLVVGIIDFMRQYTWDKHLETWVKTSGILGGPKNAQPTVISPDQYKKRFRKAMTTYFLMVPDQWSPPMIIPTESSDLNEENSKILASPWFALEVSSRWTYQIKIV